MKSEFLLAFNQICSERGLPAEVVLDALRTALVSAYRRNTTVSTAQNVSVEIDEQTGQAAIYVEKEAVLDVHNPDTEVAIEIARKIDPQVNPNETVMVESTPKDFGRIAAQTAKQVILQRIREAEREALYEDYIGREGEIINGVVQSVTSQSISLNLGRTEAILPRKEQVPGERYTLHQRLRAYVVEVKRSGRGPQIVVSRSHKNMLRRLLELEVPEIYNGAVEINAIAREAGARSKVAVSARQVGVDPVGSCVGMRGVRIQSIVNELGGEKIDVIEWDPDPAVFIAKALSPARVLTVHLDEDLGDGRTATVVVPDDQLSLAIGREGQNARLAAKLTNWRIDIKSVTEAAREALAQTHKEEVKEGLGRFATLLPSVASVLEQRGETQVPYNTEQLLLLRQMIDSVHEYFAAKRRAEREARAEKEAARRAAVKPGAAERPAEQEKAGVPQAAYEVSLEDMGLSTRVFNHLEKAEIDNLGQIMERLVDGDEGLLALDGVGPKALAEIKERVEATAPAAPQEVEAELEAQAEPVVEEAPAAEEEVVEVVPTEEEAAAEVEAEAEELVEAEPEVEAVAEPVPAAEVVEPEEALEVPEAEPEPEVEAVAEPEIEEEPRRVELERALAAIPADAYDIPLAVLALSGKVLNALRQADIENLGEVMELLAEGDERLLQLDGIDAKAVEEIKDQVEIMVSIPSQEPAFETSTEQQESEATSFPRYEYVEDDEFGEKAASRRRRSKTRRRPGGEEDREDAGRRRRRSRRSDEWNDYGK
jgi:N utilization substance protein A